MKKIILFIIYSACLLITYYSSYGANHAEYQQHLINNAIVENDHEFFLKFNEQYNDQEIFSNDNIHVYESYTDVRYYNFIITNLDTNKLEVFNYENITSFIVSSDKGSVANELYASAYLLSNIYVVNISLDDIVNKCGNEITNIKFINQYDVTLIDIDVNIEISEFDYSSFKDGYNSEELKSLYTFDSFSIIIKELLKFHLIFGLVLVVYTIGSLILKRLLK